MNWEKANIFPNTFSIHAFPPYLNATKKLVKPSIHENSSSHFSSYYHVRRSIGGQPGGVQGRVGTNVVCCRESYLRFSQG